MMRSGFLWLAFSVLVVALPFFDSTALQAQAVLPPSIDAGSIGRENRRFERNTLEQAAPTKLPQSAVAAPERLPVVAFPGGGTTVHLTRVDFSESKFLSPAELDAIAAPYIGKNVDLSQIQQIVNAVNEVYIKRGLVTANADLPPQKLNNGVLRIRLTEGRLGSLKVEGNRQNSASFYTSRLSVSPNETIDVPALTTQINTLNRTGEAQLRLALQPGTSFGLTDLTLTAIEPPVNFLQGFVDNYGVPSVGRLEGGLLYRHYGLLGNDDQLTFYGLAARGNLTGNVAYSMAVTPSGGRIGFSYTRDGIRIVNGPFLPLDITGYSQIGAVNFSHPLFINDHFFVLGVASVSDTSSKTVQEITTIADNNTIKGTAGVSATYTSDTFTITVTPTYSRASSRFAVTQDSEDYNLADGILQANFKLPYGFNALVLANGQFSGQKLLPGDQLFQIGGPLSVRGYDSNSVAGDSGYYANFELHHGLEQIYKGLDAFAFVDNGNVYSTFPAVTTLTSTGAGLSLNIDNRATAQVFFGVPLKEAIANQPRYSVYARATFTTF